LRYPASAGAGAFHVKSPGVPSAVLGDLWSLCERYALDAGQRDRLLAILERLDADELAPTAVREPEGALRTHLADSLAALEVDVVRSALTIADLGSGAGFPGLPLAVAMPAVELRLVESQRRKCAFVEDVCRAAEIVNVRTVCARAEEWGEGIDANDVVLARALAAPPVVLEYAAPLLRLGGALVDWRGRRNADEEAAAAAAASVLGLELLAIHRAEPYAGAREHHLHLYLKVGSTPVRFPRRAGVARKRPLGC
jgi:16S rRNA (guanine527-N7)-methyltransferase